MRSRASLDSSREVAQGCEVSFINYFYLVSLIIGQNFCATCATTNQTEPRSCRLPEREEIFRSPEWSAIYLARFDAEKKVRDGNH